MTKAGPITRKTKTFSRQSHCIRQILFSRTNLLLYSTKLQASYRYLTAKGKKFLSNNCSGSDTEKYSRFIDSTKRPAVSLFLQRMKAHINISPGYSKITKWKNTIWASCWVRLLLPVIPSISRSWNIPASQERW